MFRALSMATAIGLSIFVYVPAQAATPYPTKSTPAPQDLGSVAAQAAAGLTVTLPLKLRDEAGAEALLRAVSQAGGASLHQFLTPAEFKARFAQSDSDVAATIAFLGTFGLTAERVGATSLQVTGTAAAFERAFQVSLHRYQVAASDTTPSYTFQAPASAPRIPAEISAVVAGVVGLSTRPMYAPHYLKRSEKLLQAHESSHSSGLINAFGSLTVADFSKYYNVVPLAEKNVTGAGRTLGIVTLASFTPSDAFAYWKAVGLKVKSNRITVVNIDGGPGAPSDASGSLETTIDVEQSGGIAPGADVIVYQAPNTNQAFLDAFVKAVESNKAESISTSWGEWEWFDNLANAPVTDPYNGETVSSLTAFHQVFLQAALQGQSLFAAAGDAGAYDANDGATPPDFSLALSVDNPASDPYITASGGTTLAGQQTYALPKGTLTVTIAHERVWSWDYLVPLCDDLKMDPIDCGIFPVGGGGGVSFEFGLPFYQAGLSGIQVTQPDQSFIDEDTIPPTTLVDIPAHYAGRNVPDISFNADPDTGYVVYYTSSATGFGKETFWGGTSFVGPQLNGVTGLIGQYLGSRVGLLNLPMYDLARRSGAYTGNGAPFNVIKYGNNDFYVGRDGYSPAAGIGTLNVTDFAEALKRIF
ncbi:MAG: protease pro-enzyme activation domain-containing protein [Steroidobacteraceae bacterium]|jgi:subtilase family serine protease